jgi:predicted DNA-binding transcriptional regulator AlpA
MTKPKKPFPKMPRSVPPAAPVEDVAPIRVLTKIEVLALLGGISHVTLWDMIRRGAFPPAVVLGPEGGHRSKVGWIDAEVYRAIANMPRRMPKAVTP